MRIAWTGPLDATGGVPTMGKMLMRDVLAQGVEIDYFSTFSQEHVTSLLGNHHNLRYVKVPHWWEWNRWYSRNGTLAFLSNFYARAQSYRAICDLIAENHKVRRYDCVMQFSQLELLRLKKYLKQLPPVIVYPCVHAAGEYKWQRLESAYARASEGNLRHYITRVFLWYRTLVQRRQSRLPAMVIGMSKRFNELFQQDYGYPPEKMRVLYHPIDPPTEKIEVPPVGPKVRIVFAGRISVRKGTEMVIDLSRRLDDLASEVEIEVIGGHTQWSDYRKHMTELNPKVAKYIGQQGNTQLLTTFSRSDILITPSHYEPGGLVVGEAASRGMCIVATDEVGSAEPLEGSFVIKFKAGDMDAFERAVRDMVKRVKADRATLGEEAQRAALEQFHPPKIATQLVGYLKEAAK